ncbi:replication factor C large subunit [Methanosarcina sp. DH2]|uniref:replication factor C large subunit n=1 Tax=Methanosarcina sp. DH2 TaxID=2605639 RepID=UPI001E5CF81D|nr:replication factor C large subunit [Methanosarcina sp. DH2]MCC4771166.1 replication factor C large subunit [Methanosarcina sp. DH2]
MVWFMMMSAIEWAEKYRPRTLGDVVGNKKAIQDFRVWAEEWQSRIPERRAVILYGPAGIGKTSSAHALARDMDWEVIELNASDQRTAGVIEKIAGSAASMNTFFGGKRLIILDEADNIHGTSDRGGMRALSGIIKSTLQPMVLIANDIYGLTPTIRNLCLEIKFGSVQSRSMVPALKKVCEAEGVYCSQEAVLQIAENAGGDFRSAMNDLQAAANGKEAIEVEDISTAGRDVKENIFKAMQKIFKSTDCKRALESARGLDESPEDLVHWIDENLPIQYARKDGDLEDIRAGFCYLSKADLYLGRVKKRQNYRMWRYASMLMVCGAALSKTRPYPGFIKYQQPSLWRRLGQTRSKRDMRDNIASKIGEHSFESMHYSRNNLMGFYSRMLKDEVSAVEVTANLGLELEELMYLSGSTKASKKLQKIYDEAQKLLGEIKDKTEEPDFFKAPVPSVDEKQKTLSCPVNIPEKKQEAPSGKPEIPESQPSEGKQKTLNLGFDTPPEALEKKETLEKKAAVEKKETFETKKTSGQKLLADPELAENSLLSLSESLPEKEQFFEFLQKPLSIPSKEKDLVEDLVDIELPKQRITDKVLASADMQENTGEGLKKAEPKNQKTLFDF